MEHIQPMYNPLPTSEEATKARKLAMHFYAHGSCQFLALCYVLMYPTTSFYEAVLSNPWGKAMLCDYFGSSLFATLYLWVRNGPPMFYVPCRVWALFVPFLGNFIMLTYIGFLLHTYEAIVPAVLPATFLPSPAPNCDRIQTIMLGTFFSVSCGVSVIGYFKAFQDQTLIDGIIHIFTHAWSFLLGAFLLFSLIFPVFFVIVRHGPSCEVDVIPWIGFFTLFGNRVTYAIVCSLAFQAMSTDTHFDTVLLREQNHP